MTDKPTFVIVGASLAGAKAAETLREEGFDGRVVLLGEETERPYERPPLSKGYLAGNDDKSVIYVHDADWYAAHDVELRLGTRVTAIDRAAHQVEVADGERLYYTKLLLATGSSPRRLEVPGADLGGVRYLRRVEDSERLREAFRAGGPIVVIGGGWIGLETAAAARGYGADVTILEPLPTPLHRVLGPELGEVFARLHRDHGATLRLGTEVAELRGEHGEVSEVVTADGEALAAKTVVVGVGITPNTDLARAAGLEVDNGIVVDAALRTADPDIYAAGDVANAEHPRYGRRIRVEHWANALHGGPAAARAMLGQQVSYDRVPYFYTDQHDLGMEYAGYVAPGQETRIVYRGDVGAGEFVAFWLVDGRVVAGMNVNVWDVTDHIQALIRSGEPVDVARLRDPDRHSPTQAGTAPRAPVSGSSSPRASASPVTWLSTGFTRATPSPSARSPPGKGASSRWAATPWPSTATTREPCTPSPRPAPTWAARWSGTARRRAGTAPATAHALGLPAP
jgi:3-phenylpropionate/trans-cinnamate dioxygenase ferredoxin reductase subunit